ncbi:MAG TPA: hypothetical protein DD728_10550, partial [Hyphomonas atlantica]|nr:hypothetical protein [Hyphomonas atlantica]
GLVAAAAGVPVMAQAQNASGDGWKLCNETSYIIETAVGRPVGGSITVDGWTKLQPGSCQIAVKAPLDPKFHYVYGRTSTAHRGGLREWGGGRDLCVDPTGSFSLESPPNCTAMGLEERGFRSVEIKSRSRWTTTFTEIENYSPDMAQAAGIQRLLEEAGVLSGAIDGRIGYKTRTAIAKFLEENNLPESTSDA